MTLDEARKRTPADQWHLDHCDPAAFHLLRELVEQVKGLRADMARQRDHRSVIASSLSREDRAFLMQLLPAIGGTIGSELFNSVEICEHEAAALRLVCAGLTARQLGRLLRRAAETPIGGYMVDRQGLEAGAVLWRVVQVPEFPGNEKVSVPPASRRDRS